MHFGLHIGSHRATKCTYIFPNHWLASFSYAALKVEQRGRSVCLWVGLWVGLSAYAPITGKRGPKSKIGVDHLGIDYQVTLY